MPSPRFRRALPWLAIITLPLGIWCGRSLHAATSERQSQPEPSRAVRTPEAPGNHLSESGNARNSAEAPKEFFVVPPEAMLRIRVQLLDGLSLNREECRVMGLAESQIQELELVVDDAITRWREREKTSAKIISTDGSTTVLHIPPADPKAAEEEYLSLKEKVAQIGGENLKALLHFRLTDGNSPTRSSNAGTGMLNVLTAGSGTFHRFVRVKPNANGSSEYDVIDVQPRNLKQPIDGALFDKFSKEVSYEQRWRNSSREVPDRLTHLLPSK